MSKVLEIINTEKLSLDFIAGLVTSQGYFSWVTQHRTQQKVPVFQIRLPYDEKDLLFGFKNSLGLKEPIYEYRSKNRSFVLLLIRKRKSIKEIIIPAFDQKLRGKKKKQFDQWKEAFFQEEKNWRYHYFQKNKGPKIMENEKL